MRNPGKLFEDDFKKSVQLPTWGNRYIDGTASWDKNEKTRFQAKNICDFELFDYKHGLFLCELKSTKQKSMSFEKETEKKTAMIKEKRVNRMIKVIGDTPGLHGFYVLNFREPENRVFAVPVTSIKNYINYGQRKSIPLQWCEDVGLEIPVKLLRVRFRYSIHLAEWVEKSLERRAIDK